MIRLLIGVSGSIALVMFIWGGFTWITAAGNADRVKKGRQIFTWSVIGLILIFGSYAILNAIFQIVRT